MSRYPLLPGPEPELNRRRRYIPVSAPVFGKEEQENVRRCVHSGWISSRGAYLGEFERSFSSFCGARYGICCSSGTSALHLALAGLRVGAGDEVIMPSFTMIATALAAVYQGARPVFVDSEPDTGNIDPGKIERAVTRRTKAVICAHIYGHPCDMDPIMRIARRRGLAVVEDAAESHGAEYKGRRVGSIGDAGAFSFYGNKIITTGEGGMLVTNRLRLKERVVYLKNMAFCARRHFWHREVGFNYRMSNIQAAIGLAQVHRLEEFIARKRAIARLYGRLLAGIPGIVLPVEKPYARSVYWMYGIRVLREAGITRDHLRRKLAATGIETRSFFIPLHLQPVFAGSRPARGGFPVADAFCSEGLYLPSGAGLTTAQVRIVADAVRKIIR